MIPRDRARSGGRGAGRGQKHIDTVAAPLVLVRYDLIDCVADDRRKGHVPSAGLPPETSHLVFGQRHLRSDHAGMITITQIVM